MSKELLEKETTLPQDNQKVADRCNTIVSNLDCPNHGTAWSYKDNIMRPQMTDAFSPI